MKTYEEMIEFSALETRNQGNCKLRYHGWAVCIMLSETYGVSQQQVAFDIKARADEIEAQEKKDRKEKSRADNIARMTANLERKRTT